ncbi:MAG: HlyD family efflux transporter periplasmic adaptor subunit [Ferruginibacter sp.]
MPIINDYPNEQVIEKPLNGHKVDHAGPYLAVRSEEVQDIISRMPHWIVRRGTAVLFVVVILLFSGSYFIRYPDVITTNVYITSSNPPVKIVAQGSGKIKQMFVQNNQHVKEGQNICLLDNTASYHDIATLKTILSGLDTTINIDNALQHISFARSIQLGDLQGGYADLYQSINQYLFFKARNFTSQKLGQLQSQISYQTQLDAELRNKDKLLAEQLRLENKKFQADSTLVRDKVIAPLEFDNSRKELINKQINADATKTSLLQNKLQQTEYLKNMTELQQQKLQQENDLQQNIKENVKRLQGQMDQWEQTYLIKSPVDGNTVFFKFWKENQFVSNGESLLVIVPPVQTYAAKSSLPLNGAGKVKAGQKVHIKLSAYPFEEFGMIRGTVKTISSVALDTAYSMEIQLSNGLVTTANKKVPPQPFLPGTAEVLTNDRSVLERLFDKLWINNQ